MTRNSNAITNRTTQSHRGGEPHDISLKDWVICNKEKVTAHTMYLASIKGSLTATTSISSLEVAIRSTNLPIRPNPAWMQCHTQKTLPPDHFSFELYTLCDNYVVSWYMQNSCKQPLSCKPYGICYNTTPECPLYIPADNFTWNEITGKAQKLSTTPISPGTYH